MAGDPDFLKRWLTATPGQCATLVQVELVKPTALTLRLAMRELSTPGSPPRVWEPALDDIGPVQHRVQYCSSAPSLATFDFRIAPRRLAAQAPGDVATDLFYAYQWKGARVTAWWWPIGLSDFAKAEPIFLEGEVVRPQDEDLSVRVYCQQRSAWDRELLDKTDRQSDPRVSEKSIGLPRGGIAMGDLRGIKARLPADPYGSFQQAMEAVGGLRRAGMRGTVTSLGKGAGSKGTVLFTKHECALFNDDTAGATPAIEAGDRLANIDPDGADVFNGPAGAGFHFDDIVVAGSQPFAVYFPVMAMDSQQPAANPADNARAATDPFNDTSYAELDYDAVPSKRELLLALPDTTPLGRAIGVYLGAGWSTNLGATHLEAELIDGSGTRVGPPAPLTGSAGFDDKLGIIWPVDIVTGGSVGDGWQLGFYGFRLRIYFGTDFSPGAATGEKARIYFGGAPTWFRPSWPVSTPASTYRVKPIGYRFHHGKPDWWRGDVIYREATTPETDRVDSAFYWTGLGAKDDGSGTFSGVADALLESPADLIRWLLTTYCGETSFETGVGVRGSFIDARDDLKTWRGSDMKASLGVDEFRMSSKAITDLAAAGGLCPFISARTGKWKVCAWKTGLETNFPIKFTINDIIGDAGPRLIQHDDEVMNSITLRYAFDAWQRRCVLELGLGKERSSSGHDYRNIRDEDLTVRANETDRFQWTDGAGTQTVNLTVAPYAEPMDLAAHLQGLIRAVTLGGGGSGVYVAIVWGSEIVAGFNDWLDVDHNGTTKSVQLTPGRYSFEDLVAHAAAQLNSVSSGWGGSYSRATGKTTITAAPLRKLLCGSGPHFAQSAWPTLGFKYADHVHTLAGSSTGEYAVEEERFAVLWSSAVSIPFETGSHGIDASLRTCGPLLGFDIARDRAAAEFHIPESHKNSREILAGESINDHGEFGEPIELRGVSDTDTAKELRNRTFDLRRDPPSETQLPTFRAPNIDLFDVFECDGSIDTRRKFHAYGSDGSWVGKKFTVVGYEKHSVPEPRIEISGYLDPGSV